MYIYYYYLLLILGRVYLSRMEMEIVFLILCQPLWLNIRPSNAEDNAGNIAQCDKQTPLALIGHKKAAQISRQFFVPLLKEPKTELL